MAASLPPVESVRERSRVGALVEHPLRLAILHAASAPSSATEIAAGLGLPRQRVNYHIGRLRRAGFLVPAGRRKRRGLFEQRYVATAQAYVLDPAVLGPVRARTDLISDRLSAEYLVALSSQIQSDLSQVLSEAAHLDKRVATMSISAEIRFAGPEQRADFARGLERAIARLVGRYAGPAQSADGKPLSGRLFRLVVGCYPPPASTGAPGEGTNAAG
jgi:DNA-binding transcriptional ArsR family regulator